LARKKSCRELSKERGLFFAVTFVVDELAHGKLVADVAKEQGVKVFIYGSLPNVEKLSGGKLVVPNFTGKGQVEEYVRGLGFEYTSFPQPAAYHSNFNTFLKPKENNGVWELSLPINPDAPVEWISISDYGAAVAAVLNDLKKYNGRAWAVTSERASFQQHLDTITKLTGKKTRFISVPYEAAVAAGRRQQADMFKWFEQCGNFGPETDVKEFKALYPQAKSFEQFVRDTNYLQ